jgi:Calcineurin-like phosphoesterase superfamily domain
VNEYLFEDKPARTFERIAALADCDVLVFGHTHKPWIHDHAGIRFVNCGAVGKPKDTIHAPLSRSSKRRTVRSRRRFGGSVTTQARWRTRCGLWGYPKSSRRSSSQGPESANRPRSQLRLHIFTISQPPTP